MDPGAARRIVDAAAILGGETVVEIGPGDGALTKPLLEVASGRLLGIEIDPLRAEALGRSLGFGGLKILHGDALDRPISAWIAEAGLPPPAVIVANLPYNAATAIVSRAIEESGVVSRIIATLQREVARRFVATPGSDDYGYLSVRAALFSRGEVLFDIPAGSFRPRPKVVSSVLRLMPMAPPVGGAALERVLSIASAAFQMRRKNLPNALAAIGPRPAWALALDRCGFPPSCRAEELAAADFVRLAEEERKISERSE